MTSFASIFGVLPLVVSSGAGAEMRQALGTAVFFGMLGGKCLDGWTKSFLIMVVGTTVTGFLFPFHGDDPGNQGPSPVQCAVTHL